MSTYPPRSPEEGRYAFDETIFRPREGRMPLPPDRFEAFEEVQSFDQIWLWALMGFELIVILVAMFSAGQPLWVAGIGLGAITLSMALLSSIKLITRIDEQGVHYRFKPFHFKVQTIPWEDIDQIHVRKYSPILEYGGWGIRFGRNGRAYNIRGNTGIQIVRKNGKRLLIGTQRPDEAAQQLGRHPLLV